MVWSGDHSAYEHVQIRLRAHFLLSVRTLKSSLTHEYCYCLCSVRAANHCSRSAGLREGVAQDLLRTCMLRFVVASVPITLFPLLML